MIKIPTERQEQRALVKWLSYHPTLKHFYCKTNNEGKRTDIQGHNLHLMGLRPGVSDLFIYYPTKTYHGLWLEVKRNKKYSLSEKKTPTWVAQEEFINIVNGVGYCGRFCYGFTDAQQIVLNYLLS